MEEILASYPSYPDWVEKALNRIDLGEEEYDVAFHFLSQFKRKWGGLSIDALIKAILSQDAVDDEHGIQKAFAITALYYKDKQVLQSNAPFEDLLQQDNFWVRWPIALALGEEKDKRALDTLCFLLTEGIEARHFFYEYGYEKSSIFFRLVWRMSIPELLLKLDDPIAVPYLRATLAHTTQLASEVNPQWQALESTEAYPPLLSYQFRLVFTLGHFKAWGCLDKIDIEESLYYTLLVLLILGSLYPMYKIYTYTTFTEDALLRERVITALQEIYGLSRQEIKRSLAYFESNPWVIHFTCFYSQ